LSFPGVTSNALKTIILFVVSWRTFCASFVRRFVRRFVRELRPSAIHTRKGREMQVGDNLKHALTREQVRELDRTAIEDFGIPGVVLMENAGRIAADEAERMLSHPLISIFAGKGNNGGDGFVIARHLHNRGAAVVVNFLGVVEQAMQGASDAAINLHIIRKMGIPVRELTSPDAVRESLEDASHAGLIIDALFGTGLNGPLCGLALNIVDGINALGVPVLAVDIPTGLDANTGEVLGASVRADKTVTFVAAKRGFFSGKGPELTGQVVVAEISIPRELIELVMNNKA